MFAGMLHAGGLADMRLRLQAGQANGNSTSLDMAVSHGSTRALSFPVAVWRVLNLSLLRRLEM